MLIILIVFGTAGALVVERLLDHVHENYEIVWGGQDNSEG